MPVTEGGSPAQVVWDVINNAWVNADNRTRDSQENIRSAIGAIGSVRMGAPTISLTNVPQKPVIPLPQNEDAAAEARFNQLRGVLINDLSDRFADFIRTYFPSPTYFSEALNWCHKAITTGGTGVNASVERQLWERDRARVSAEFAKAEDETTAQWADRGFALPAGAMVQRVADMRLNAAKELAASSREIAIKAFETEVENIRFAVKALFDLRQATMDAAVRYIGALAGGDDAAARVATALAGLKNDFARTLAQLYSAEVSALDPIVKIGITNAELKQRTNEALLQASMTMAKMRIDAAVAGAQMLGTQAAAGINAVSAGARVSA